MSNTGFKWLIGLVVSVIVILWGVFTFTERVPEGKVSVVYTPSAGAKKVLNPGWHMIGFFDKTQQYPTRISIVKTHVSVTTQDGKKIKLPVSYEMKVDKAKVLSIFRELGSQDIEQLQEGYLSQKLFKSAREIVSHYSVLDIFGTKTTEASAKVTEKMAKTSGKMGFIITDVTLGNPDVDKATQAAIDARVQAAQQLEKLTLEKQIAEQTAERNRIEAKGLAEAQIEKARGAADSKLLAARAEAEANRVISASLTEQILKLEEIKARQAHGWVTIQGAGPVVTTTK